jgi:hypothetical protein
MADQWSKRDVSHDVNQGSTATKALSDLGKRRGN